MQDDIIIDLTNVTHGIFTFGFSFEMFPRGSSTQD
jgi:hypothetical protein